MITKLQYYSKDIYKDGINSKQLWTILISHLFWVLSLLVFKPIFQGFDHVVFVGILSIVNLVCLQFCGEARSEYFALKVNRSWVFLFCFNSGMYFSYALYWMAFHSVFSIQGATLVLLELVLIMMLLGKVEGKKIKPHTKPMPARVIVESVSSILADVLFFYFLWQCAKGVLL